MAEKKAYPGVLHHYATRLVAFEWSRDQAAASGGQDISSVIFIGGLFDDLATVPLIFPIADSLPSNWRLVQARLSSSSFGWGISSLDKDVEELGQLVGYLRKLRPEGKIILMGHSTGSQDVMHYAVSRHTSKGARPPVDGYILQAGISDRQGYPPVLDDIPETEKLAQQYVDRGDGEEILPKKPSGFLFPVSARRFLSLTSPGPDHAGQDDMFSNDLSDERLKQTFGKLGESKVPVQILFSDEDQYVPIEVEKEELVERWHKVIKDHGGNVHEQSGIVPDMDHNGQYASDEALAGLADRVAAFAKSIG